MTSSKSLRRHSLVPSIFRSNTDPDYSSTVSGKTKTISKPAPVPNSKAGFNASPSLDNSPSTPTSDPKRKPWHKSSTIDLSQLRRPGAASTSALSSPSLLSPTPEDVVRPRDDTDIDVLSRSSNCQIPSSAQMPAKQTTNSSAATPNIPVSQSQPQLRSKENRKSKFWGDRLSSLLPSLILPSDSATETPPRQATQSSNTPVAAVSVPASTVTAAASPAQTKSSTSPTNTANTTTTAATSTTTASTSIDESNSSTTSSIVEPTIRVAGDNQDSLGVVAHPSPTRMYPSNGFPPGVATFPPPEESAAFDFSPSTGNPQIMDPIPPSPDTQRAVLNIPEPTSPPPAPPSSASPSKKLRKDNPDARRRSGSLQHYSNDDPGIQPLKSRQTSPMPDRGRRSSSAQVPSQPSSRSNSRVTSAPLNVRPSSSKGDVSQSPTRGRLRRSWLPGGGRSRSNSMDVTNANNTHAWILSDDAQTEYNTTFLKNGEKVPELWNESGTVLVYLYPKGSGHGPSFKVQEFTVSSSIIFNELIQSDRDSPVGRSRARSFTGRDSLTAEDATRFLSPPNSPPVVDYSDELRLYIPPPSAPSSGNGQPAAAGAAANLQGQPDLDRLIAVRNLFAFLTGQPLVATKARPTNFHALLQISYLLEEFAFTNYDGTGFGDAVELSFGFYMDQHALADCRHSREKTIESLILGERMRSVELYNEAFAHAAGKYSAIMDLRLPLFQQLSPHTRQGLERAHLDLANRQHIANSHLEQFEFPALFSGIANSTSMTELRQVRFKIWRSSFSKMRQFVLSYYKQTLGNWPPKASSKKNSFTESGLNRLVLKVLYSDMCALYDLLVDRTNRTSRVMDEVPALSDEADKMITSALRNIMSEFDRSKPPVLPPIPYDCPQLPTPTTIQENYYELSSKKQAKIDKNIKEHEVILLLNKAYNYDTNSLKIPFLDKFKDFELREARGKTPQDMADQRIGYWLFLYTVIQSLPVLVVDAPGITFTEGVEYFLCEPPHGNPPWIGDRQVKKMWYEVAGGGGLVELSTDAVLFSVEATYHRSHCWLAAKQWEEGNGQALAVPPEPPLSPLEPPRSMYSAGDDFVSGPPPPMGGPSTPSPPLGPQVTLRPRTQSPHGARASQAWRSSIALGLEPVPLPPPSPFGERSSSLGGRPASLMLAGSRNSSMGNLAALGNPNHPLNRQQDSPPEAATSGVTFDDILGGDEGKKPAKKKKGFF